MSTGYGKIFESLYSGSMIGAGEHVFSVWPYCLAHVRPPGVVEVNPALVSHILGTTPDKVVAALEYLCAPDPNSRSKAEDGKRLVKVGQFEYRVVNFQNYRDLLSKTERAEYKRNWDREHAETRHKSYQTRQNPTNPTQADEYANAEAKSKASNRVRLAPKGVEDELAKAVEEFVGPDEWTAKAGIWITRIRDYPLSMRSAMDDILQQVRNGRTFDNNAAFLTDLFGRFKNPAKPPKDAGKDSLKFKQDYSNVPQKNETQ